VNNACSQHAHPHRLVQQPLTELTDRLRAGSRKVTGQRQAILDVLRRHASPLTNRQIHDALGKADCDLATIYRNMHTLTEMGLVKRFDFGDGSARFELVTDESNHHHHHLVCNRCAIIVEVEDCFPSEYETELARRHGFASVSHRLEFFGLCPRCQKEPPTAPSSSGTESPISAPTGAPPVLTSKPRRGRKPAKTAP
jgi:Fur family transcriptional regulator, ferric uptake regulator